MENQDKNMIKSMFITTFNNLPSELILCIFKYLSVANRYKSFFDYDIRLRQLVKRWTSFSRKELNKDIIRFSSLHSWHKISLQNGGRLCFIYPRKSQQSKANNLDNVSDTTNLHWWFAYCEEVPIIDDERIRTIISRHSFRLTPFFYRDPTRDWLDSEIDSEQLSRNSYGGHTIFNRNRENYLEPWLNSNYPDQANQLLNSSMNPLPNIDGLFRPIFVAEWLRLTQIIREAARQIWDELKCLEDVNPFEIYASRE